MKKENLYILAAIAGIVLFSFIASIFAPVTSTITGESVGLLLSTTIVSGMLIVIASVVLIPLSYLEESDQNKRRILREFDS